MSEWGQDDAAPRRCVTHGLVTGPDGRCVICRREEGNGAGPVASAERGRGGALLGLLLVAGLGGGTYYWYAGRSSTKAPVARAPAADAAARAPILVNPVRRTIVARRPTQVPRPRLDAPLPPVPPRPPPPAPPRPPQPPQPREDPLAARRRMDRMYEEALLSQAASRISITMYMADW
jgi:hypothetical protein